MSRVRAACVLAVLVAGGCSGGAGEPATTASTVPATTAAPPATSTPSSIGPTAGATTSGPAPAGTCLPRWAEASEFSMDVEAAVERIATGDFDGDGWTDVLVARMIFQSPESFGIDVLLGDGTGLRMATSRLFGDTPPELTHPAAVVVEDFNGDGVDDVFVADTGMDAHPFPGAQNTLLLSIPGGGVADTTGGLPQQHDQSHDAAAGDVDLDGDLDLFVANLSGGGVPPQIWVNDGHGAFTVSDLLPPAQSDLTRNWYTAAVFADPDGDGDLDLVLGHGDPGRDSQLLANDGTGSYSRHPSDLPPTPLGDRDLVLDIEAVDLDGDHLDDLVVVSTHTDYTGHHLQALISNGDGTFTD
ncbi:MAG: VCBS repeat-containing protein [Actinobacteria bacterium]|nr:VCBS repeat-containing protein [Actinomycetota bacterium]